MYKVFFNDRTILIGADHDRMLSDNPAIVHNYKSKEELRNVIDDFLNREKIGDLLLCHSDPDNLFEDFKSLFRCMPAAGGLVVNTKGEYLGILKRGRWDLPKGKVDGNESLQEAALREITEECGITAMKIDRTLNTTYHIFFQGDQRILKCTHWFRITYHGDEKLKPQAKENIKEVKWITDKEEAIFRDSTYPSIIEILDQRSP